MGQYDPKKPSKINPVSITVTLVILGIGYLGWFYIPHWWPIFRMSGVMRGIASDGYRIIDDEALLKKLVKDTKRFGLPIDENNFKVYRLPWTPEELQEEEVPSKRELMRKRGKWCVVEFAMEKDVTWPLTHKVQRLRFHKTVKQDMSWIEY